MDKSTNAPLWDAFVSYASEDRAQVAQPLVEALRSLGLRIWFDQTELRVGDSLRDRIDAGLLRSRYGVVVLSQAFFGKHYPVRELDGLAQREVAGEKVILPVWYGVDVEAVRRFSLPLADRMAAKWVDGIDVVVDALFRVIGARLLAEATEASKRIHDLPEAKGGRDLIGAIQGAYAHSFVHDDFESADEATRVGDFLQTLEDWIDGLEEVGAGERAKLAFELTEVLRELDSHGWKVFADLVMEPMRHGAKETWPVSCVAVVRRDRERVARVEQRFIVVKATKRPDANAPDNTPDPGAYTDRRARYLGGHPDFDERIEGTLTIIDSAITFTAADGSMRFVLRRADIESVCYRLDKLHFEQAEIEESVAIDPDATLLRPTTMVTISDPEAIYPDGLDIRFGFRNEYYAKLFEKQVATRFGVGPF